MGFLRYSEQELRDLLGRAIPIRWPAERLVILTPCRADGTDGATGGADPPTITGPWECDAVLAVTPSRLIYQERLTHSGLIRAIGVVLAVAAVAALFTGGGLSSFAIIGITALALWCAARLTELATMGGTSIEFQSIAFIDRLGQRIEGISRPGAPLRLAVADPSDFRMIVSLVDPHGLAA